MDVKRILNYLADLSANNNRDWYQAHKDEYLVCRADFEELGKLWPPFRCLITR